MAGDDITLQVRSSSVSAAAGLGVQVNSGREISGWTAVRITRGIERCPSDFEIGLTDPSGPGSRLFVAAPGDRCSLYIGDDLVITGFVDRYSPTLTPSSHGITVAGRGRCADLGDCSAEWPGGQISGATALGIAQKLAAPYGISVKLQGQEDPGLPIPVTSLSHIETPWQLIERTCRYRALLAYEDEDGNLVLAQAGTQITASGLQLRPQPDGAGNNIQSATATFAMDERFSDYAAWLMAMETTEDAGAAGFAIATAKDPGVPRHRLKNIIAEGAYGGADLAQRRVNWESARRLGRATQLHVTVDSWRDGAGSLWAPNTLVPVDIPDLKLNAAKLLLVEVTYTRDNAGTRADLVLMPQQAFLPEPIAPPAFQDLPAGAGGSPSP